MSLRKFSILLLISLISLLLAAKPDDKDTAAALRQSSTLLKQEGIRWKSIHGSPSKDEVILIEEETSFKILLTIDPVVKNIVNNQSITREYVINKEPDLKRGWLNTIIADSDLYFMGGFNTNLNTDIGILAGYHPRMLHNFGIGPMICIRSLYVVVYYSGGKINMDHVIMGFGIGTDYSGPVSNFMLGVKF